MIKEIITSILILAGALFMLLASLGIFRMPDIFMRMHAATKAVSMGMMLLLVALSVYFPTLPVILKSLAAIIFFYLTLPVSASLLGRTAREMGLKQWRRKNGDEPSQTTDPTASGDAESSRTQ